MKKIAGLVVALVAVFTITGCGSSTKYDFTCTGKVDGQEATIKGLVKNDKVTKVIMEETIEAPSAEEAKQSAELSKAMGAMFSSMGVTLDTKVSGKKVTMTMTMDVEKVLKAQEDSKNSDGMSFTSSIDFSDVTKDGFIATLKKQGLTCK